MTDCQGWMVAVACGLMAVCSGPLHSATPGAKTPERPHIVVIMLDDLGFSDLGCYGGEVRTPHIDQLAAQGLRWTSFYNAGRCCPTRASLLTGVYPHQAGLGRMTFDAGRPGYRGELAQATPTVAERLAEAGYRTAMVGKWHVSRTDPLPNRAEQLRWLNHQGFFDRPFAQPQALPVARGFEEHYGVIWGVVDFFDPFSLIHNHQPVREVPEDFYITNAFNERAVEFVEKYATGGEPLFLYIAHTAPHWPLHALPEDIAKYEGTFDGGWDAIREARFRRQHELGLWPENTITLPPRQRPQRQWQDEPHPAWESRAMAVHAAMVDRVDQGVGRLVAKLRELGQLDNTLILVLSDNGASPERLAQPGFDRNSQTRDGRQVHYPGNQPDPARPPGDQTTYAGIGPLWASTANTPFRYWKAQQYEGGIATPLVMHWPNGLRLAPGSVTGRVGHVIDLLPTCLDLAGLPRDRPNAAIPIEGQSLLPVLRDEPVEPRTLYFEHFHARAIRQGDWKLVAHSDRPHQWELYDLAHDRAEHHNVAERHPELVERLAAAWQTWAERAQVLPRP